jgi:hypothetical protein
MTDDQDSPDPPPGTLADNAAHDGLFYKLHLVPA